ncbi:MAG: hypothetical protein ABI193_17355 [Minicystis sp.]
MWNSEKTGRLDGLRLQEAQRSLTENEQEELEKLLEELDLAEAQAMRPALDRLAQEADELRAEKARVMRRAQELEHIVAQQESLLAEVHAYAGRVRLRRAALVDEFHRLKAS